MDIEDTSSNKLMPENTKMYRNNHKYPYEVTINISIVALLAAGIELNLGHRHLPRVTT